MEKKYRRHPKRLKTLIENKIILLKENKPSITLFAAQKLLKNEGIKVSKKGIWSIWKRFGLAGFARNKFSPSFTEYISISSEIISAIKKAEQEFEKGNIDEAAHILNSLHVCPTVPFLKRIPDKLLSLPRRVEKLYVIYGQIPFIELKRKAKNLRQLSKAKGLLYLSVRAGIIEALTLEWLHESEKLLILIQQLQECARNREKIFKGNPYLRFVLLILQGQAYGNLLRIKESLNCARKCRIILRSFPLLSEARYWLGGLFTSIGHYRESLKLLKPVASIVKNPNILTSYASIIAITGEYRSALSVLNKSRKNLQEYLYSQASLIRAMCNLSQGKIEKALGFAQLALKESKKEGFRNQYHIATLILASGYAALNEKGRAKELLERPIPLLKKFRMERDLLVRQTLLDKTSHIDCDEKENITPPIRLALMLKKAKDTLKIKDYRRAYAYAKSQKIMGYFHLYLLFLPESIHHILSKGKPTHLPSQFLKLPVFQKDIPAYHLTLLGPVRIYRNNNPIRAHLPQKMAVFLIHICLKQGNAIPLTSLYKNFWEKSKNPARTFSHFLVRIRKYLKLSSHSLYISRKSLNREKSLYFSSHITTDYQEFEQTLTQAKALERAGEWGFAKREYLRAFKLFRGEPFEKMYDNWSEHMRRVILNRVESEAIDFVKSCLERKNKANAKKVLERITKIIPQSEEIKKMVRGFGCRSWNDI